VKYEAFKASGNWYKGNLHSHTVISDGILTPSETVELYKKNGYSFLSMSEHDIFTDHREEFDTENFITIPSIEYSAILYESKDKMIRSKIHHLHGILGTEEMQKNAVNGTLKHMQRIPPMLFEKTWDGADVSQKMNDMLIKHGCVTTYNHPIWSRVEGKEFINVKGLSIIEVFNFNTVLESDTGYDVVYWDTMLRSGMKINAFAADDNHNEGLFEDSCGGWISVKAKSLTHENIVSALIAGEYYSSSGPEIYEWGVENEVVHIKCSGVYKIVFVCGNVINDGLSLRGTLGEDDISQAEYKLKGHEIYIRAECRDKYGRTAWSNPIYLK